MNALRLMKAALLAATLAVALPVLAHDQQSYETGMIPADHILLPDGAINANVFLISGEKGWGDQEQKEAQALLAKGAVVVGIDFPQYLAAMKANDDECIYMISDIEQLAQEIQRKAGVANYRPPIIAGIGEGATLALAMIAQSPAATIGEAIAVDPLAGIPLDKVLCTPATKDKDGDRTVYGLTDGPLPAPVKVLFTDKADAKGREHVAALLKDHPDIDISDESDDASTDPYRPHRRGSRLRQSARPAADHP